MMGSTTFSVGFYFLTIVDLFLCNNHMQHIKNRLTIDRYKGSTVHFVLIMTELDLAISWPVVGVVAGITSITYPGYCSKLNINNNNM